MAKEAIREQVSPTQIDHKLAPHKPLSLREELYRFHPLASGPEEDAAIALIKSLTAVIVTLGSVAIGLNLYAEWLAQKRGMRPGEITKIINDKTMDDAKRSINDAKDKVKGILGIGDKKKRSRRK